MQKFEQDAFCCKKGDGKDECIVDMSNRDSGPHTVSLLDVAAAHWGESSDERRSYLLAALQLGKPVESALVHLSFDTLDVPEQFALLGVIVYRCPMLFRDLVGRGYL